MTESMFKHCNILLPLPSHILFYEIGWLAYSRNLPQLIMSLTYSGFLNLFSKNLPAHRWQPQCSVITISRRLNNPCALNNQENRRVKWKAMPRSAVHVFEDSSALMPGGYMGILSILECKSLSQHLFQQHLQTVHAVSS